MGMGLRLFALTLGVALPAPPASAGETQVEVLLRGGSLRCEPALRRFCGNIHIGCSGRSAIEAVPFRVSADTDAAQLDFAEAGAPVAGLPRGGPLTIPEDRSYALVRLRPEADYFRLEADGRYNIRLYHRGTALMSYGVCRKAER